MFGSHLAQTVPTARAISLFLTLLVLRTPPARALDLVTVDTAGWCGTFTSGVWTVRARPTPADGHLRFNAADDNLRATFPADLLFVDVAARASNDSPLRSLFLSAFHGTTRVFGPTNLTPHTVCRGYERFWIGRQGHADGFALALGAGRSGAWTIYALRAGVVESRVVQAAVAGVGCAGFSVCWTNGREVAWNELELGVTGWRPAQADYLVDYDFAPLTNTLGVTRSVLDGIQARWSGFGGYNVMLPAGAGGYAMIGKRDTRGVLSYATSGSCRDLLLVVCARRHAGSDDGWLMPVRATDGARTNDLAVLTLSDMPRTFVLPLADLPEDATLLFHSVTNRATATRDNARTDLLAFGLARRYEPAGPVTNVVCALTGVTGTCHRFRGCAAETDYLWRVRGVGADGWAEPWPPPGSVRTHAPKGCGLCLW